MSTENTDQEIETTETIVDVVSREFEKLDPDSGDNQDSDIKDNAGSARDDKGRFASKKEALTDGSQEISNQENLQQDGTQKDIVDQPKDKPVDYTSLGFRREEIDKLAGLPADVAQVLVERNNRYHEGIKDLKGRAQIADTFINALQPHAEYLSALQISPSDFIPSLVGMEKTLRLGNPQQQIEAIKRIAHEYQIDLMQAAQAPFDPRQAELMQQIEYKDRQLANFHNAQESAEMQNLIEYVNAWGEGKEYFHELQPFMAELLELGKAKTLDEAYDKASRYDDNIWNKLNESKRLKDLTTQAKATNQRAVSAKASAVQVSGSSGGFVNKPEFKSLADEIAYIAQQQGL